MTTYRVQVRMPMFTLIPEDVITNTLYFSSLTPAPTEAECLEIRTRINAFYQAVGARLSPVIPRTANACSIVMYDMGAPEPRAPLYGPWTFTLPASSGAVGLPNEVAIVMSFQADRLSGAPQARRRGRIYFGPLNTLQLDGGGTAAFPRPAAAALTNLAVSANLLSPDESPDLRWIVWSQVEQLGHVITNGWLNNEFDTQRRRGVTASSRTLYDVFT